MTGTPLMITPEVRKSLLELAEQAHKNPVDMAVLMKRIVEPEYKALHMKQMTAQTVPVPYAYLVTYSLEINQAGGRTCRHMSMSVAREGRLPNEHALWAIAEILGFTGTFLECVMRPDCNIYPEDLKGHGQAINIVQTILEGEKR